MDRHDHIRRIIRTKKPPYAPLSRPHWCNHQAHLYHALWTDAANRKLDSRNRDRDIRSL
jgi:hypothetical protein